MERITKNRNNRKGKAKSLIEIDASQLKKIPSFKGLYRSVSMFARVTTIVYQGGQIDNYGHKKHAIHNFKHFTSRMPVSGIKFDGMNYRIFMEQNTKGVVSLICLERESNKQFRDLPRGHRFHRSIPA